MAHTKRSKEAKCIPVETLTKRLAASFAAIGWQVEASISVEDVANHLGVQTEDVQALVVAGLLKATPQRYSLDTVEGAELVRFLDTNPWWFRVRAEAQVQHLRAELNAIAYRARRARLNARAARKAVAA